MDEAHPQRMPVATRRQAILRSRGLDEKAARHERETANEDLRPLGATALLDHRPSVGRSPRKRRVTGSDRRTGGAGMATSRHLRAGEVRRLDHSAMVLSGAARAAGPGRRAPPQAPPGRGPADVGDRPVAPGAARPIRGAPELERPVALGQSGRPGGRPVRPAADAVLFDDPAIPQGPGVGEAAASDLAADRRRSGGRGQARRAGDPRLRGRACGIPGPLGLPRRLAQGADSGRGMADARAVRRSRRPLPGGLPSAMVSVRDRGKHRPRTVAGLHEERPAARRDERQRRGDDRHGDRRRPGQARRIARDDAALQPLHERQAGTSVGRYRRKADGHAGRRGRSFARHAQPSHPGLGRARLQPQAPFRDRPDAARSFPRRPLGDAALSRRRGAQARLHPNRATRPAQERRNHRHRGSPFRGAEPIPPSRPPRSPLCGLGSDPRPSDRRPPGHSAVPTVPSGQSPKRRRLAPIAGAGLDRTRRRAGRQRHGAAARPSDRTPDGDRIASPLSR